MASLQLEGSAIGPVYLGSCSYSMWILSLAVLHLENLF